MDFDNYFVKFFVFTICMLYQTTECAEWTYDGETGVHHWHRLFPKACSGRFQSPINIESHKTKYNKSLRDFAIWFDPPKPGTRMTIKNNGHAIKVNIDGDFFITNGGLGNVYKTAQFHFHWGEGNFHGSEHLVNGKQYPLELHAVHYNYDLYDDLMEAVTQPQGLAVLGTLYEISEKDNPVLETVIKHLHKVQDPDADEVEIDPISIRYFLPRDIRKYYRYNGSLTTPGCFESVIWTVFEEIQTISERQLMEFRKVLKAKHKKHGKKHNRNKRSNNHKGRRERAAETVIEELGIEDDPKAQDKLEMEVEFSNVREGGLDETAEVEKQNGDDAIRIGGNANSFKDLPQDANEEFKENKMDAHHDDDDDDNKAERHHQHPLLNNYRPVQPLNGRIVYRSFRAFSKNQESSKRSRTRTEYRSETEEMEVYSPVKGGNGAAKTTSGPMLVSVIIAWFCLQLL